VKSARQPFAAGGPMSPRVPTTLDVRRAIATVSHVSTNSPHNQFSFAGPGKVAINAVNP
jgi:hypothetical protein